MPCDALRWMTPGPCCRWRAADNAHDESDFELAMMAAEASARRFGCDDEPDGTEEEPAPTSRRAAFSLIASTRSRAAPIARPRSSNFGTWLVSPGKASLRSSNPDLMLRCAR